MANQYQYINYHHKNNYRYSLICAVSDGRLERARELITPFGLSCCSGGYLLLREAIKNKHTEIVKLLLTRGCRFKSKNKKPTDTALHFAAIAGNIEIVKMILDKGINIDAKNRYGRTPLHTAIENMNMEVAEFLLHHGADINARDQYGTSLLHVAIERGCLQIVEYLLKYGALDGAYVNCTSTWEKGYAPLHFATETGSEKVVTLLLSRGANVDVKGGDSITPLHIAAKKGYVHIAEHLLNQGACTHSLTLKEEYTPLHFAVENGSKEIVTLLLSRGANCDVKGEDNITPLHIAAKKGYVHIAEHLLNQGACTHSLTLKEEYTPLHFASEQDNEIAVKLFLNRGTDINASTKGNLTPLHIATKMGHTTVVRLLLQHGAKVDSQDKDGKTVLHLAVEKGYLKIVKDVLKYCPDINNESNRRSLEIAVLRYGKIYKEIVEALVEYGLFVSQEDTNNPKLLHAAVEKGCLKIVGDLLKYGADVNMLHDSTKGGFTPLHSAVENKHEEVAELLIIYEADINAKDKTGKTPIFYAIENADLKITKLLLTNKANIKGSPELLNIAVKKECLEIAEALLQHDADINASDEYGRTALHYTVVRESDEFFRFTNEDPDSTIKGEIARLLLSKGADVNSQTKNGETALYIAIQNGYKDVVKVLLEFGAEVDSKIKSDITPLHLAAKRGCQEIVEIILKCGADINSRDEYGRTALHIASREGHTEVVATLLEYGSDINITSRKNRTPLGQAMVRMPFNGYNSDDDYNYDSDDDYDYGSDDDDDDDDDDYYSESYERTVETLTCHIVKMKTANLYISEKNLRSLSSSVRIHDHDFQDKCEEEIANMKSEKINNANISVYDVLAKGISSLAIYMRNENIVQGLKSEDYKKKFPIYASMIGSNFRKGMERKELLEQANTIFHSLFSNFPELPHVCTDKIFSYLSNKDLRKLIDASKPFSISTRNGNDAAE